MDDNLTKAIADMSDAECRAKVSELAHENTRLRLILDTLARAGVGKGALVEFDAPPGQVRVVVCRADVDERAFAESMLDALREVMAMMGGTGREEDSGLMGVVSLPTNGGE